MLMVPAATVVEPEAPSAISKVPLITSIWLRVTLVVYAAEPVPPKIFKPLVLAAFSPTLMVSEPVPEIVTLPPLA